METTKKYFKFMENMPQENGTGTQTIIGFILSITMYIFNLMDIDRIYHYVFMLMSLVSISFVIIINFTKAMGELVKLVIFIRKFFIKK